MTTVMTSQNSDSQPDPGESLLDKLSIKDSKALIDDFEKKYKQAKDARVPFEREWYLNIAFYFGKQWVQWVKAGGASDFARLIEPPVPPWRVRLVSNKIKPIIRKELAKINQERPRGFVVPSSSDDEDLAAARAGDAIYEHVTTQDLRLASVMWRASFWMVLCGTGFVKDWYDPKEYDAAGMEGRIKAEPLSPFHILVPDVEEQELDHQPYVIQAMGKDPDWIEMLFGKKVQADSKGGAGLLEQKFLNALGISSGAMRDKVVVKEIWIKPSAKYKNGLVAMWANNEILHVTEGHPYAHGEYPFTKIDHIPTGRFYGQSTIVDLIPLQKEYNRTRSQVIEAKNRMSKPQLIAPKGSVDPRKITTEPGLVIQYTPGFTPPQPIPLQNLPQYVLEELDRTQRDMDDISSQHEVSKGRTPPGVEAATAIAYLQEQDDTVIAHTVDSVETAHERVGKHLLAHVGQFWDAERTIRVVGKNSFYEAYVFKGSDLRGNTDFKVVSGSAAPRSRAAKQAHIMELMKLGFIPPDRGLQFLDMGETARLYEEMQIDVRQAQRENLKMSHGQPAPVNVWDNHQIHILEHDAYRKRQEFEQLDENAQMIFQQHVEGHKMANALEMGQPMEMGNPMLTGMAKGTLQAPPGMEQDQGQGQQPAQQQLPMEGM